MVVDEGDDKKRCYQMACRRRFVDLRGAEKGKISEMLRKKTTYSILLNSPGLPMCFIETLPGEITEIESPLKPIYSGSTGVSDAVGVGVPPVFVRAF